MHQAGVITGVSLIYAPLVKLSNLLSNASFICHLELTTLETEMYTHTGSLRCICWPPLI